MFSDRVYHLSSKLALTALAVLALGGCAKHRGEGPFHAYGYVAGQPVNARVDSRLAEYYVERGTWDDSATPSLQAQLHHLQQAIGPGVPSRETLAWITRHYSRDVATILLAERLAHAPVNQQFHADYARQLEQVVCGEMDPAAPSAFKSEVLFLVVPGWYWRDESYDGSLNVPRRYLARHGYATELLPTVETASVEDNARLVAQRLRQLQDAGRLVVLVSVSKGSAETALALGKLLSWDESRHVLAWLNVNGGLRGSPLADEMLSFPRRVGTRLGLWLGYGDDGSGLVSMRSERRRRVYQSLRFPPHVLSVNFTAIPLSSQVVPRSRNVDRLLDPYGPHDGSLLIRDELIEGAPTVVEIGYDHYFFDPMIGVKSLALVRVLEQWLMQGTEFSRPGTTSWAREGSRH